VHLKGGIISLGCDRFGLQRSPLAYGRLKLIATALYRHGPLSPRHFIATALYRHGVLSPRPLSPRHFIATASIATAFYRHGVAQGALNFAIP
jgi:hypothetical protein